LFVGSPKASLSTFSNPARGNVQGAFSVCSVDASDASASCQVKDAAAEAADELRATDDDVNDQLMGASVMGLSGLEDNLRGGRVSTKISILLIEYFHSLMKYFKKIYFP
jgi:hypothetical protein